MRRLRRKRVWATVIVEGDNVNSIVYADLFRLIRRVAGIYEEHVQYRLVEGLRTEVSRVRLEVEAYKLEDVKAAASKVEKQHHVKVVVKQRQTPPPPYLL